MLNILIAIALTARPCAQKWDSETNQPISRQINNGTVMMCKQIVRRPRLGIANKLCLCNSGRWKPLDYGGSNGKVDVQFFGDILGAAKQLCAIFKSIDCIERDAREGWYVKDTTDFGLVGNASSDSYVLSGLVEMKDGRGASKLVDKSDLFDVVEGICKFIDDGAGSLPGLLPERPVDGIFGWLGRLLDGLFDFFDIFRNGLLPGKSLYERDIR